MTWLEYFRTKFPLTTALLNAEACKQYTFSIDGMVFSKLGVWADLEKLCWMAWDKELEQTHAGLMKNSPEKIRQFCNQVDADLQKQLSFIEKHRHDDFSSKSLFELKEILTENLKLAFPVIGKLLILIDAFDIYSEKHLKAVLRQKTGSRLNEKEREKLFGKITVPDYTTYVILEEKDSWQAAIEIKRGAKPEQKTQELFDQYWWSELGWERKPAKTPGFFKQKLRELDTSSTQELEEKIRDIDKSKKDSMQERETAIRQFSLQELKPVLELMDQFAKYHDVRKESQMKSNWLNFRIIDALSAKTGISGELLDNATFEELFGLCQGKPVDIGILQQRTESYYYELNGHTETLFSGKKALEKIASIAQIPEFFGNFGGTIASKGVVTGKAKICFGSTDALKKIQTGDILVTGMTTPDFVPAMRKAGAIVTDEGGMTCHAAIISRELGIPCIVGTKIGTKVLKDNDIIEVNANHGVIKKLEKPK